MPDYTLADLLQGRTPQNLLAAWAAPPAPVRAHGKGSVQEIAPEQTGQSNFLFRAPGYVASAADSVLRLFGRDPNEPPARPGNALAQWWAGNAAPQDVAAEFANAAPPVLTGGVRIPNPIRAYHGSPHRFDEFGPLEQHRLKGEGANAYGAGYYFAENEGVARSYRDTLGSRNPPAQIAADVGPASSGRGWSVWGPPDPANPSHTGMPVELSTHGTRAEALRRIDEMWAEARATPRGHMYEVNIHARPEQFLDWDRPLSGQSPEVAQSLNRIGVDTVDRLGPAEQNARLAYEAWLANPSPATDAAYRTAQEALLSARVPSVSQMVHGGSREISERLQGAGIPGVRYFDQGSRLAHSTGRVDGRPLSPGDQIGSSAIGALNDLGSPQAAIAQLERAAANTRHADEANMFRQAAELIRSGRATIDSNAATSNYVLFDENLIEILRRYGLLGPVAGTGGAATLMGDQPQ